MPPKAKPSLLVGRVLLGLLLVALSAVMALLGGFLNHCRGGYVHFGPHNMTTEDYNRWYWPQHTLGRLLFALPTGLVVIVFGLHMRASLVVSFMTWFSLYVGWGSYMNIGMDDNYCSREGTFDWLVGRQAYNCSVYLRFVREYSGMSLRGLVWTLPQGYVLEQLGFGWEYSLTGSVMPLIYLIGANTNTTHVHGHRMKKLLDGSIAVSELIWGMWLWFVLIIACFSQGVRRARIWIYQRNSLSGFKPFSTYETILYRSMNRPIIRGFYEGLVIVLTVTYVFSAIFYSLVNQVDLRNKGQTFFGLLTAVLFLVFAQAWLWGVRYRTFFQKRLARRLRGRTRTNNAIYDGGGAGGGGSGGGGSNGGMASPRMSKEPDDSPELARTLSLGGPEDLDHCRGLSDAANSITPSPPPHPAPSSPRRAPQGPLLSWPYSHPDRLSPTEEQRQQVLDMCGHMYPQAGGGSSPFRRRASFSAVWSRLERLVWMDIFIYARRTVSVVTLICTIFSLMITVTAMITGWDNVRFLQDLEPPCELNETLLLPALSNIY